MAKKKHNYPKIRKAILIRQLARYAREALRNSIRLLEDAILLYQKRRWGTSFYIATISIEEIGKCFLVDEELYNVRYLERDVPETLKWLKLTNDHAVKQSRFARESRAMVPIDFVNLIMDKQLDRKKQQALYVDIESRRCEKLFRIITPNQITEPMTRRQITIAQEGILDLIRNGIREYSRYEIGTNTPPMDKVTYEAVRKAWKATYKTRKTDYWAIVSTRAQTKRVHNKSLKPTP